jgi:hypothetical protein
LSREGEIEDAKMSGKWEKEDSRETQGQLSREAVSMLVIFFNIKLV